MKIVLLKAALLKVILLKVVLSIIGLLLLISCMSVPLSTMIKMAGLSAEDILTINPDEVRVRLSIAEPFELQHKNVRLALQFEYEDDQIFEYKYLLEIIDVKEVNPVFSWFSSEALKHAYRFKLASLSKLEFNKVKKNYSTIGKPQRYYWTVYYYLKNNASLNRSTNIDMELKLSEQDEYFYLLKNAAVEINDLSEPEKVN